MASKIIKVLGSLDIKKEVGPDGVSCHMLRCCSKELCFLYYLHAYMWVWGEIPSSWKVSHITPVHKQKGSASDLRSYCPIVLLHTVAMVFERVTHSQLQNHTIYFIPSTQFGFIKGTGAKDCGTTIALLPFKY